MKKLILSIFLCMFSSSLIAQIELVSSSPAAGDIAVNQDSIVLEFNLPVMIDTEDPESTGFYFWIEPEAKVILDSISVNETYTKVTFYGQLEPDTDYLAILEKVVGMQGESLLTPYIIQFTTAEQAGEYTVSGQLTDETMAKLKASDSYNGFVVVLGDIPFTMTYEEDYEEEEPEDILPLYAATVDTLTGEYEINGVRERTYHPFALNVFDTQEEEYYYEFYFPEIYFYDPDGNAIPDSIVVNATTTTNGELSGIDLVPFDFGPMTFSEAATKAENMLTKLDNAPALIGGYTFYTYFGDDIYFKPKSGHVLFNSDFKNLKPQIQLPPFRSSFTTKAKTDAEDIIDLISTPSGEHVMWEMYAYDAVKDSIIGLFISPFGVDLIEYIGIDEAELPEGVQFSDFKLLPETYIDSDQAAQIMEENGGINFRKGFEGMGFWDMELQLLHEFWTYKPDPTPNAPIFWKGSYYGAIFDYENEEYTEDSLTIFVDITTGEILYSETSQMEAITFGQAVTMARAAAENLENDPIIVAGGTDYWYEPPFYYYGPEYDKQRTKSSNSFLANLSTEDSHYGWQVEPNGYQLEWEIYGYDAVKDSAFGYGVTADTAEFGGYISVEEAELPPGVTFSSIKPLPETYIDSDEAAAIAEREGGERFRNRHNISNQEQHGYWDVWLQAMHEYWTYEPNPTVDAPVFWKASYYGSNYYHETEEYVEDSLLVYIDIESGDVLHMVVSNERINEVPAEIQLLQNYPNPFNPTTNIPFHLNKSVKVSVNIYNMLGQKVSTLFNDALPAGSHTLTWDANGLASGVYFYRLEAGGVVQTRKMLLLK